MKLFAQINKRNRSPSGFMKGLCLRLLAGCWLAGCASMPAAGALATPSLRLEPDNTYLATLEVEPLPQTHRRWAGPFYEDADWGAAARKMQALRPFYNRFVEPQADYSRTEWLWPLVSWRRIGAMRSSRILLAFFQNFDVADPRSQSRAWILPFFFSGHSREREPYFGVFPIAGRIDDILGSDRVRFVLFPLYADSRKGSAETLHLLWPVFSSTRGDAVRRWRVFPFYGQAHEANGTRRRFILWPFWTSLQRDGTRDDGGGFVLFPLFGSVRTEKQQTVMLFPPLFRHSTSARETETYFPWPFLQRATGTVEKLYLWPLWGRKSTGPISSAFFLWPLYRSGRQVGGDAVATQRTFFPFYYSRRIDSTPYPAAGADEGAATAAVKRRATRRYEKIWPFFSYQRDERSALFRMIDIWPGRTVAPIERNYAPFWTLYSYSRSDSVREQELLWGLFRQRVGADGARHTRLFPLVSWESEPTENRRAVTLLQGLLRFGNENGRSFGSALFFWRWGRDPRQL